MTAMPYDIHLCRTEGLIKLWCLFEVFVFYPISIVCVCQISGVCVSLSVFCQISVVCVCARQIGGAGSGVWFICACHDCDIDFFAILHVLEQ